MKAVLVLGVLLGFGGVLAAASLYPWFDHPRLPAKTTVVANGGRSERFVIHLPADRIQSAGGTAAAGLRATTHPSGTTVPAEFAAAPLLVEHFKVRDTEDRVIGIAARHWTEADGSGAAAWALLIPGRGALLLAADGEPGRRVDTALARAGYAAGTAWSGDLPIAVAAGDALGRVVGGSNEFANFAGTYAETWQVTGVSPEGELRGTVALDTITQRSTAL